MEVGVSECHSPQVMLSQENLDCNKHCVAPFGACAQVSHEADPTNANTLQTIDTVCLQPTKNIQGGHEVMDLNSGHVVTCQKVAEILVMR